MGKKTQTFLEFLQEQDRETIIYVGTEKGSAWLWIESAAWLLEHMKKNEKKLHDKAEKTLKVAEKTCHDIPYRLAVLYGKHDAAKDDETRKVLETAIGQAETDWNGAYNTRKKFVEILRKWVPLNQRKVVETYMHKTEVQGPCVIIEGYDNGRLWSVDEK